MLEKYSRSIFYSLLAGSGLLYFWLDPLYRTGYLNDDALYVIRAREFAHNFPFRSLLVRPDYPLPGLPLLLAPLIKLAGPHWTSLERVSILATLLSVFLLWTWTRRWLSEGESLAIAALFALNPIVARFSGIIMPEPYYALAVIASFALLSRLLEAPTWITAAALGFTVGWGSLLRPEAILILAGILPALFFHRNGRRIVRIAAVPIVLWLFVFHLMKHARANLQTEYGGDIAALASYWSHSFFTGMGFAAHFLRVVLINTLTALRLPRTPAWLALIIPLGFFYLWAMGAGFRNLWKKDPSRRSLLVGIALFCGLYFAVHVFWHVSTRRYAIPLLPFLLIFLVHGVNTLCSSLKNRTLWTGLAFVLLLVPSIYRDGWEARETFFAPNPMYSPPWRSLAWINAQTPADVQVLSDIASNVELYTDRQALVTVAADNSEMLLYRLLEDHLDYIVYRQMSFITPGVAGADNPNRAWNQVNRWAAHHPDRFPLVFADADEKTSIYQVTPEPGFVEAYEKIKEATDDYEAGRFDDAFRLAKQSIQLDPQLGLAYNLLGAMYLRQNDLVRTERAWLKATELMPDSSNALVNLATFYRMTGQTNRIAEYFRRANKIADETEAQDLYQSNMKNLQKEWDHRRALLFIDPLTLSFEHSPTSKNP